MTKQARFLFVLASTSGFSAVLLGAFGAHGLRETLEARGRVSVWETAVLYHSLHALFLLILACWGTSQAWVFRAGMMAFVGILMFSGSLYLLSLGGPSWLGPVTPLGGLLFLGAWLSVGWSSVSRKSSERGSTNQQMGV